MVSVPSKAHCGQYGGVGSRVYVMSIVYVHAFMCDSGGPPGCPGLTGCGCGGATAVVVAGAGCAGIIGPPGLYGMGVGVGVAAATTWTGSIGPPGLHGSGRAASSARRASSWTGWADMLAAQAASGNSLLSFIGPGRDLHVKREGERR
jgi:hypothetical protein